MGAPPSDDSVQAPGCTRRRIWSEDVGYDTLRERRVLDLLCAFGVEPCIAVRPWNAGELPSLLGAYADRGVRVAVWPMLADADGRWANARNATSFCDFVRGVLDRAARDDARVAELTVDFEPPIAEVRALLAAGGWLAAARIVRDAGV